LDVDRLRSILEAPVSTPLRWLDNEDFFPGEREIDPGVPPVGFERETDVDLRVLPPLELLVRDFDPGYCDEVGHCTFTFDVPIEGDEPETIVCDYSTSAPVFRVPLEAELSTRDGAIDPVRVRGIEHFFAGDAMDVIELQLHADLTEVKGMLRLEPSRPGAHVGRLDATLVIRRGSARGSLRPVIYGHDPQEEAEPSLSSFDWRHLPLVGRWPDDPCEVEDLPVTESTPEGRQALELIAGRLESDVQAINAFYPVDALWDDDPTSAERSSRAAITSSPWCAIQARRRVCLGRWRRWPGT
jgi:hypothetical protein